MSDSVIFTFLSEAKSAYNPNNKTIVVLGNQAADLDSMVSSILYGFYLSQRHPEETVLPVINIPQKDYKLRTEAVYLFNQIGVSAENLIFIDQVDLDELARKNNLRFILVDHNRLTVAEERLRDFIVEIIDHHENEKQHPRNARIDIRPVGSTATLVAERLLNLKHVRNFKDINRLLLGTILLDTVNLSPEVGKTTDTDRKIVKRLLTLSGLDQQTLFDTLKEIKFSDTKLNCYDLLRMDYKEWDSGRLKYGISFIPISAGELLGKRESIQEIFQQNLEEKNLDFLIIMNGSLAPDFIRDLLIYITNSIILSRISRFLESSDLGLKKMKPPGFDGKNTVAAYSQENIKVSRKKLMPLLNDFLKKTF
jgi:exopolyphosphatase